MLCIMVWLRDPVSCIQYTGKLRPCMVTGHISCKFQENHARHELASYWIQDTGSCSHTIRQGRTTSNLREEDKVVQYTVSWGLFILHAFEKKVLLSHKSGQVHSEVPEGKVYQELYAWSISEIIIPREYMLKNGGKSIKGCKNSLLFLRSCHKCVHALDCVLCGRNERGTTALENPF